jgi:hypothetical protein
MYNNAIGGWWARAHAGPPSSATDAPVQVQRIYRLELYKANITKMAKKNLRQNTQSTSIHAEAGAMSPFRKK